MLLGDVIKAWSVPLQRSFILSHFAYIFAYLYVIIFDQLINIWKERGIVFWNPFGVGRSAVCFKRSTWALLGYLSLRESWWYMWLMEFSKITSSAFYRFVFFLSRKAVRQLDLGGFHLWLTFIYLDKQTGERHGNFSFLLWLTAAPWHFFPFFRLTLALTSICQIKIFSVSSSFCLPVWWVHVLLFLALMTYSQCFLWAEGAGHTQRMESCTGF